MAEFFLYRHGETAGSRRGYYLGPRFVTDSILPEAKTIIERLAGYTSQYGPFDLHLSSPFPRCRQTSAIVAERISQQPIFENRLIDHPIVEPE